jgi:hypothetical protein
MSAFVGFRKATGEELSKLVKDATITLPSTCYFLRWPYGVSGIQMNLPDHFPSPEGQLFNAELELRWKKRGTSYEVLFLGKVQPNTELEFSPLEGKWEWCDRDAYFYNSDETKFPKGFLYQDAKGQRLDPKASPFKQVKQRYFRDAYTTKIHFVALTV